MPHAAAEGGGCMSARLVPPLGVAHPAELGHAKITQRQNISLGGPGPHLGLADSQAERSHPSWVP